MHIGSTRPCTRNTVDAHRLLHLALEPGGPRPAGAAERGPDGGVLRARRATSRTTGAAVAVAARRRARRRRRSTTCWPATATRDASTADVAQARAYGATGVPFFVIEERYGVSGAQPTELFTQVLEQAWAEADPLQMAGAADAEACGPEGCPI